MTNLTKGLIARLCADCLITALLLVVAFNFFSFFKYRARRGFFCNDDSLKYPYRSDSVCSIQMFYLNCLYMPVIVIVAGEAVLYILQRFRTNSVKESINIATFLKLHFNLTTFLSGFALQALFLHVVKINMGRLRPHFFEVCQPYRRLDGSTCDNPKNHGIYIQDYECNGESDPTISREMLIDVYLSFPSGHSSYIFYGMIFIVVYLQRFSNTLRQYRITLGLSVMVIQMLCILLAWFISVSRVMDHKHHWSDVLVGIVLGVSVATASSLFVHQQLRIVNSWPEGIKSTSLKSEITTYSTTSTTTIPSAISVP